MPNYSSDVPFTGTDFINVEGRFPDNINSSYTNAYVSETMLIRKSELKQMIVDYGAVYSSVYCGDYAKINENTGAIYTNETYAPTHAVTVVGWDDNYSRDNFLSSSKPSMNGAWLIKNSWGTDWGEDGYGWISYEETSFGTGNSCAVVSGMNKRSKNEYMLSYDFMNLSAKSSLIATNNMVYLANVYDVSELNDVYGSISKVMFYSLANNTIYRVYITPLDENGNIPPISQIGSSKAFGTVVYEGYRTAELIEPYVIDPNVDKYAVIIGFGTDSSSLTVVSESIQTNASINPGESYLYKNGTWIDKTNNDGAGNYCIRPILVRRNSITKDSQISTSAVNYQGDDITIDLTLNGNQLYCIWNGADILSEDVDFTRSGNNITFKQSFLNDLYTTSYTNIVFEFTDGANQILKIYPKALSDVTISGKVAKGQTLTASVTCKDGTVPVSQQLTYQWQSSNNGDVWNDISGANAPEYTLTSSDRGYYIRCAVSVSDTVNNVLPETKYSTSTATKVVRYGDADLDGDVDTFDSTAIQRYIANLAQFSPEQIVAADVDGDGIINAFDTTAVQRYIAGYITSFPVET